MQNSDSEFKKFIEYNLSQASHISCIVLYMKSEYLAWCAALRLSEIIRDYFKKTKNKQIDIPINMEYKKIIPMLKGMRENDLLLLSIDNKHIEILSSFLVSETLDEKRNIIFISRDDNPLNKPFKAIANIIINVQSISERKLECDIVISGKDQRELRLNLPNRSLIDKYRDYKEALLREAIRRQVPELDNRD